MNKKLPQSNCVDTTSPALSPLIALLRQSVAVTSLVVAFGSWQVADSRAETVFETATLGPTGLSENLGYGIYFDQFLGARFELASSITTTSIGGHFGTAVSIGNNQFFGALVALTDAADFPDSPDLSTPDVLGTALLTFPNPSAEVSGVLSVDLNPGFYALVFGSGLFGATGSGGGAILNNNLVGTPSWLSYNPSPEDWRNVNLDGIRFFVTGVPEPNTAALLTIGSLGIVLIRLRQSRVGLLARAVHS